ncbi:YbjN domain-containing protein [Antrihabitans cavernicola]|uniref:YbjN domain-containing protein n=1 Tax=Antrihabitans cavernicola TaxID=2495913 RepID=A0A5A7SAP7_9NOCA|nr:hypothetical protein [Spelaeibacter cavernicola]KAA0022996.1 hypothetical protein FOY51_10880 [Spelaeibacter cavernicola]
MSDNAASELQTRAQEALSHMMEVRVTEDGSVGFEYGGALCSLRAVTLSPGLDVLSLTCVLAWDRPLRAALTKRVADRNNALQFGSITVIGNGKLADVIMRYTFPGTGLSDEALTTMLLLVLSGVDRSRQGLVP